MAVSDGDALPDEQAGQETEEQDTEEVEEQSTQRWLTLDENDPSSRFRLKDEIPIWGQIALRRRMKRAFDEDSRGALNTSGYLLDMIELLSDAALYEGEVDRFDRWVIRHDSPDLFNRIQDEITLVVFGESSRPLELRSTSSTSSSTTPPGSPGGSSRPVTALKAAPVKAPQDRKPKTKTKRASGSSTS